MSHELQNELRVLSKRVSTESDEGILIHALIEAVQKARNVADQALELAITTNALANSNWTRIHDLATHAPVKYGPEQPRGDNRHNDTWFQTDSEDVIIGIHTFNHGENRWESKKFDKKSIVW